MPVSATASAQPVSTPSTASSSRGGIELPSTRSVPVHLPRPPPGADGQPARAPLAADVGQRGLELALRPPGGPWPGTRPRARRSAPPSRRPAPRPPGGTRAARPGAAGAGAERRPDPAEHLRRGRRSSARPPPVAEALRRRLRQVARPGPRRSAARTGSRAERPAARAAPAAAPPRSGGATRTPAPAAGRSRARRGRRRRPPRAPPARAGAPAPSGCRSSPGRPRSTRRTGSRRRQRRRAVEPLAAAA